MERLSEDKSITCRVCYQEDSKMFPIFVKTNGVSPYANLMQYTKLNITTNNGCSDSICSQCYEELNITVNFFNKCLRANELFETQKLNIAGDIENDKLFINEDTIPCEVEQNDIQKGTANKKMFVCQCCDKAFTRKGNLKLHLNKHNGERNWHCLKCGAGVLTKGLALRHCVPRKRQACPTPGCDKTYLSLNSLKIHIRKHTGEKPFECADCFKKFRCKNTLRDHMKIHSGIKRYMCPTCGKQFSTNKLSSHMRTHSPNAFPCPACPRLCPTRRALLQHGRTHAPPARAHACPLCAARYNHRQSLNKHIKKRHVLDNNNTTEASLQRNKF